MEKEISKQHTQLPNKMAEKDLDPKDQLIYVVIKSFQNGKTLECFPSLQTIASKSGASIPTIRASIKRLEEKEYITVEKKGRSNYYKFNSSKQFEPFSPEFINRQDISLTTKAYLVASQQFMFKDVEGIGKISYPNTEFSKKIHMAESTIRKCDKELEKIEMLNIINNDSRDPESGCKTRTKVYNLDKLGQAIIWKLKEHDNRLDSCEDRLAKLEESDKKKSDLIERLLKENAELKKTVRDPYVM